MVELDGISTVSELDTALEDVAVEVPAPKILTSIEYELQTVVIV